MKKNRSNRPLRRFGGASRLWLLVPPLLLGGCIGPTDTVETLIWEGTLQPVTGGSLLMTGSVGMVSGQFNSQIGIGVENAEPGTVLRWNVRRGDCSAEGELLVNASVFPPLEVDSSGEGSTGVQLSGRLSTTQSYAAWVSPSDAEASPVACAALTLRD